jgi:hypothetical protein
VTFGAVPEPRLCPEELREIREEIRRSQAPRRIRSKDNKPVLHVHTQSSHESVSKDVYCVKLLESRIERLAFR